MKTAKLCSLASDPVERPLDGRDLPEEPLMPTRACLIVALLSLFAAACGRGEDPPTATAAYDDFVKEITDTTCERVYQCPEKAPALVFYLGRFESEVECKIFLQESSKAAESTEQIKLAVDQGRIAYDAEQAETCLATLDTELAGARCAANFDADVPACDKVFVGKVSAGGSCAIDAECASDLYCEPVSSQACGGRCQALSKSGQGCGANAAPCEDDTSCLIQEGSSTGMCVADHSVANGAYCNADEQCDPNSICVNNSCQAKQDARIALEGETCELDLDVVCKPGLVCTELNLLFGNGTCKPPGGQGAPCYLFTECAAGFTCEDATVINRGSCVPVRAEGEACNEDIDCASFVCDEGTCASSEVCSL